jgi:hypothetical protein
MEVDAAEPKESFNAAEILPWPEPWPDFCAVH